MSAGDRTPGARGRSRSIGREVELAEIYRAIDDLHGGHGRPLLISGEAGIGKTLLVDDASCYAREQGVKVLATRCPHREGAPAYWPWSTLLRDCVQQAPPGLVERQPDEMQAQLARLLPGSVHLPSRDEGKMEDDRSRFELFYSVASIFEDAARDTALVLVLDDLHAADAPTLKLFEFVAGNVVRCPVLLVGTYRDVEVGKGDPLSDVVNRMPGETTRIELRGLDEANVAEVILRTVDVKPSATFVRWARSRTGGNPLFVKEVVRLLMFERSTERCLDLPPEDQVLPDSVRGIIERRLTRLPSESLEVFQWAALWGDEFDQVQLARVSEQPVSTIDRAISRARHLRLLMRARSGPGRWAFTHGLVANAMRDRMLASERAARHLRIAAVLVEIRNSGGSVPVSEISHHLQSGLPAGEPSVASSYAKAAAEEAAGKLAWEEAARLYARALDAHGLSGGAEASRAGLLVEQASALGLAGDRPESRRVSILAAESARRSGSADLLARAALVFAASPFAGSLDGGDAPTIELLQDALAGLGEADSAVRAVLLARLARENYFVDPDRFAGLCSEAIAIAGRTGDRTALWEALFQRHFALTGTVHLDQRLATSSELMRIGGETGDWERRLVGRVWQVIDLAVAGDGQALDQAIRTFVSEVEMVRLHSFRWYMELWEGAKALSAGRIDASEAHARAARSLASARGRYGDDHFGMQLAWIWIMQDRLDEVELAIAAGAEKYPALPAYRCGLAFVRSQRGDDAGARALLEGLVADGFAALPRDITWLTALTHLAETCVALADRVRGELVYTQLVPYADQHVVTGLLANYLGPVTRLLGCLAALMGRWDDAEAHFESALSRCRRFGSLLWGAQTKIDMATMLIARNRRADDGRVNELLKGARTFLRGVDVPRLQRQLERLSAPSALPPSASLPAAANVFRRDGTYWTLAFSGTSVQMGDRKGLHDIADLLASAFREIHVLDLHAARDEPRPAGGADAAIDTRTREECQRHLRELEEQIQEAERNGDVGREARARQEFADVTDYLAEAYGLTGRPRRPDDPIERARKTVWHRLRTALDAIETVHPRLSAHLRRSLSTGTFCSYSPEEPVNWTL